MPSSYRLPLFPLPLVLLPGALQPLHIFEPRYRRLLADALDGNRQFGIICRSPDVAERELPTGTVGCVGRIESSQQLPDGRANVLVAGTERFVLRSFVDDPSPYHVALVDPFIDRAATQDDEQEVATRVRTLFTRVGQAARAIQEDRTALPTLPAAPALLSFAIAQFVDLATNDKQRLLSSDSALDRLRQLEEALARMVESLEQRAYVHARARSNGHGAVE